MQKNSNYELLIQKLDTFTRKYYLNQIIRGFLYSTALILGLFLLFNLLEHQFYFEKGIRKMFFYSFIGLSGLAASYWILLPLMRYFKLGRTISHEQAAAIIGDHFSDVKDRLLNVLQLKRQSEGIGDASLINASINQKTESIKLVPFKSAIDLSKNRKYLRFALPPFLLLLVLLFAAPSLIKDSTHRIINNDKEFVKAAPFDFDIQNKTFDVLQFEDYVLDVKINGDVLPQEVFIDVDNFQYRLTKDGPDRFSYRFKNVQKNTNFQLFSGRVKSDEKELEVLPKPNLVDFSLYLDYPNYVGRTDESISNIGDVLVPQGTKIKWNFNTLNTESIALKFGNKKSVDADQKTEQRFSFYKRVMKDDLYKIYISNQHVAVPDSVAYSINVTPDQYPTINVEMFKDSVEKNLVYFIGDASDDYGLSSLSFNYTITKSSGSPITEIVKLTPPDGRDIQYDHYLDIEELELKPGDKVNFYFEVYDNDGVNGAKSAKTGVMEFEKPTVEEFEEQEDENEEEVKEKLMKSLKESKRIKKELKKMKEKMLQKNELDWQDKQELEKLMEEQKKLEDELKKAKEKFEENLENQQEFTERQEEILEKQEKIQEMFEEVLDEETQELMEKIQELMEELNKDEMMEMMEDMEMSEEEMEQEMDKLLELFKQLEVEKEIKDQIEKLEELAEKQEELAEQTEKESKSEDQLKKEQEEIQDELEKIEEKLEEIKEKNEELEVPKNMPEDMEEQMDNAQEDMEDSKESLEQQDNKSSSQSQKKAAEKMKQMAGSLQSSMQAGEMKQMEEDMQALRQLLENLVTLSFDQEDLIRDLKAIEINTPSYTELVQTQFKLKDDFQLIQDSLQALSKRNDKIESFVTEKVIEVKEHMSGSLEQLEERRTPEAGSHQRSTMENVNDLALMLSEAMNQMQQQMSGMMPGNQQCQKPGGNGQGKKGKSGNVPMDKITKGQQELSEQLKQMMKGGKSGGGQPSSKEFAKAAAKQAALRKALEEIRKSKGEEGKGGGGNLDDIIDQMNKNEIDLVNKRLNGELMKRQQNIETRLLEAEKADRTREKDNKRKAERTNEKPKELPPALQEYLKQREAEVEMYKRVSPSLRPYYKQLVDQYYKSLKGQAPSINQN